jgi:hypothetical protein
MLSKMTAANRYELEIKITSKIAGGQLWIEKKSGLPLDARSPVEVAQL